MISTASFIAMPERALLIVAGKDAAHFLHNLLTASIESLKPGEGSPAALLTPQGKVISEMLVFNAADQGDTEGLFVIDIAYGYAGDLLVRLTQYKLRADVTIGLAPAGTSVAVLLDFPNFASDDIYVFADPRHAGLGHRLYGPKDLLKTFETRFTLETQDNYHRRRVELGIPEIGKDFASLEVFPHDILLDQLGAVDFKKGCYVGQEVVSRMEHRGTARTRALPVRYEGGFGVLGGAAVRVGERQIGAVGESFGDRGIAILRLDKLSDAFQAGEAVTAGGVPVRFEKPDFVRFSMPTAQSTALPS
ncbi:COG0354 Predicted aminomethyltransferase related to GcvT [Rhabdaerophilaceae bacterium]